MIDVYCWQDGTWCRESDVADFHLQHAPAGYGIVKVLAEASDLYIDNVVSGMLWVE